MLWCGPNLTTVQSDNTTPSHDFKTPNNLHEYHLFMQILGVESFENLLKLYKSAKSSLGEILSAFEMADLEAIKCTINYMKLPYVSTIIK